MAHYLLRDGSQVSVASDPSVFEGLRSQKHLGQMVDAAFSLKAERAILRSVELEPLVEPKHARVLR